MTKCAVSDCKSSETEPKRRTYPFPDAGGLKGKWLKAIGRPDLKPTKAHRICQQHFLPDDFEKFHRLDGKLTNIPLSVPKLHPGVVPSVFPGKPHPPFPSLTLVKGPSNNVKLFDEIFLESKDLEVKLEPQENPIQILVETISSDDFLLCRVCESTEELIDISVETNSHFREKLQRISCLSNDQRDDLLKFICRACGERLEDLSSFRNQCEITLKKLLGEIVPKEENLRDLVIKEESILDLTKDDEMPSQRSSPVDSTFPDNSESIAEEPLQQSTAGLPNEPKEYANGTTIDSNSANSDTLKDSQKFKKGKRGIWRKGVSLHCPTCDKPLKNTYQVDQHRMKHQGALVCKICGVEYSCRINLKRHILTVHEKRRDYICLECNKSFTQHGDLKNHQKRYHTQNSDFKNFNNDWRMLKPYQCEVCKKSFRNQYSLKAHSSIHLSLEERLAMTKEPRPASTVSTGEKKKYVCPHCGKISSSLTLKISHMRTHTGEKPYKCTHCIRTFGSYQEHKTHLRIHTGDKPYKCSTCGAAFRQNAHLKQHSYIHTGENPHKCQVCDRGFRAHANLITHMRIHTGEKPFQCTHCPEKYTNARSLRQHNQKVHEKHQETQAKGKIQQESDLVDEVDGG